MIKYTTEKLILNPDVIMCKNRFGDWLYIDKNTYNNKKIKTARVYEKYKNNFYFFNESIKSRINKENIIEVKGV